MLRSRKRRYALIACCSFAGFVANNALSQDATVLLVAPALLASPTLAEPTPVLDAPADVPAEDASAKSQLAVPEATFPVESLPAPVVASPVATEQIAPAKAAPTAASNALTVELITPVDEKNLTPSNAASTPRQKQTTAESAIVKPRSKIPSTEIDPLAPIVPVMVDTEPAEGVTSPNLEAVPPSAAVPTSSTAPLSRQQQLRQQKEARKLAAKAPVTVLPSTFFAEMDKAREDAWRAGHPPLLNMRSENIALPDDTTLSPQRMKMSKALQPFETTQPLPIFLSAEELVGVTDHEAVATGHAEARKFGSVVYGDKLIYWPVEDELDATGNVRLEQGDNQVTGPHMRMKMSQQTGVFDTPDFMLRRDAKWAVKEQARQERGTRGSTTDFAALASWNTSAIKMSRPEEGSLMNVLGISADDPPPLPKTEVYGKADRMDFEGENKIHLFNGQYSTCSSADPGWYMHSDELKLDYDREVGEGENSTVYFQDVPIFYTPWMTFSLNGARKSGFLLPSYGSSSSNGMTLTVPYYWNIAPNMDVTVSPRYYSKRGMQLAAEGRYLAHNFATRGRIEYLSNDQQDNGNDRYAYSLVHTQNFGRGLTGTLNISHVSDDDYFADLSSRAVTTSQRQLLRQGMLSYAAPSGWWSASLTGQSYQTLNPDNELDQFIAEVYSLAPQFNITARRPDFGGFDLAFTGQFTSFIHVDANNRDPAKRKDEGQRYVAYPQISLPYVQPGWYVTPKAGLHMTHYSLERNAPGSVGTNEIDRTLPIFSVDSGMTFERETSWLGAEATQTLEPRLYYLYVPFHDQSTITNFDSGLADFNFAQIFSENQFVGYDRIADANQLTAAVTTRLIDPTSGAEAMRAMVGQRYYFEQQKVTLPGTTLRSQAATDKWNRSDFLAAFSGRVLPKTWLDATLQYNPADRRMERSSIGTRYQPQFGKVLNLSYRFASKEAAGGEAFKNVDFSGQWPLGGGWSAVGRYNYSMLDHKPVETVAGLEYNAGCWAVRIVGHQVVASTTKTNSSFFVQLELSEFARIGSNPVDLLRRNIDGYGLAGQPVADPIFGE